VLNAFRHHRDHHHLAGGTDERTNHRCSTPFGITEIITRQTPEPEEAREDLLNAFRHHRDHHNRCCAGFFRSSWCSTPFGITEIIT